MEKTATQVPRCQPHEDSVDHAEGAECQLVTRRLDELCPHPSYMRLGLRVPSAQLSALKARGSRLFQLPIVITKDRIIVDGYARVELAREEGRSTIRCIEFDWTEGEALRELLHSHRRQSGLNNFCKILLAMELEPSLKEKARVNQQVGGRRKGSSNLTEAGRVDVRAAIAAEAGVGTGNVSKVKQLLTTAQRPLLNALLCGEISINRAWLLAQKPPASQGEELGIRKMEKRIRKDTWALARKHRSMTSIIRAPADLLGQLSALALRKPDSFSVFASDARGKGVCVTNDLLLDLGLGAQQELIPNAKEQLVQANLDRYPLVLGS